MTQVIAGSTLHCNRCNEAFAAPQDTTRGRFGGSKAARLDEFCTCPHCQQTDSHWVFASDIMPTFEGGFDARKKAERRWLREN